MSRISNVLLMLKYLKNGRKYSIKELSEKLEVSQRMIRSYKNDLDQCGFIIETIRGPYGGYILKNNNINIPVSFSKNDIEILDTIKNNSNNSEKIKVIIDKIKMIVNDSSESNISDENQKKYNVLSKAIKEKRKVCIDYYSYKKGINTRVIHPYEIFYLNNSFGVAAFCETKKDLRHFDFDRIKTLKLLEENY